MFSLFREHPIITTIVFVLVLVMAYFIDVYIKKKKQQSSAEDFSLKTDNMLLEHELKSRPWIAPLCIICWICFFGGTLLNFFVLKGRIRFDIRYGIMAIIFIIGAISGLIAILTAPESIRANIRKTQLITMICNAVSFLLFGSKLLILLMRGSG